MGHAALKPLTCRDPPSGVSGPDDFENLFVEVVFKGSASSSPGFDPVRDCEPRPRVDRVQMMEAALMESRLGREDRLETRLQKLFGLQDLHGDGRLDEEELAKLNEKLAILHYGRGVDREAIKAKYRTLFRNRLDPNGTPVPYATFRRYVLQVLNEMDPNDVGAQEMILDQFICEATSARELFHCPSFYSASDAKFLSVADASTTCRKPHVELERDVLVAVI